MPQDMKKSQVYGGRKISFEQEEVTLIKKFAEPGIMLNRMLQYTYMYIPSTCILNLCSAKLLVLGAQQFNSNRLALCGDWLWYINTNLSLVTPILT